MRARVHAVLARHFPRRRRCWSWAAAPARTRWRSPRGATGGCGRPRARHAALRARSKLAAAGRAAAVRFVNAGACGAGGAVAGAGACASTGCSRTSRRSTASCRWTRCAGCWSRRCAPGGRFVGVVLPRLCPLEVALFLARGQPRTACAASGATPMADVEGVRFPMRYYGARRLRRRAGRRLPPHRDAQPGARAAAALVRPALWRAARACWRRWRPSRIGWPAVPACRAWVTTSSWSTSDGDGLVTRDESLEATALVQDTGVVVVSLGWSRAAHAALVRLLPALKAPSRPALSAAGAAVRGGLGVRRRARRRPSPGSADGAAARSARAGSC